MRGPLLKAVYQLNRHEWMGGRLDRWIAVALVLVAGLMAIRWLPGGVAGVVVCGALILSLLLLQSWAGHQQYVVFEPESPPARRQPQAPTFAPMDKHPLRATGLFEVEGKEQRFTELLAYYRSFETREHVVMAIVPPSNVLLIGNWPGHEIGMWYIFFKHGEIRRIEPGQLRFGSRERPALRLTVDQETLPETSPLDVWGGYRSGKPKIKVRRQTMFLSFDTPELRQRVLHDLVADAVNLMA